MAKIVIYNSKTGFTKQYADWIAKELACDTISIHKVTEDHLKPYQTIIYGGGITAGQIRGLKKFKNKISKNPDNKFIVFATGATPVENKANIEAIMNANFTVEEAKKIPFYYFQSGVNYENMGQGARLVLRMLSFILAKKKNKTDEEVQMIETLSKSNDLSKKSYILPLLENVRSK